MTKHPSPELALILGDFLFNVRAALDHLAAALAPPERELSAKFPIFRDPIHKLQANGQFDEQYGKQRQDFKRMVKGMPTDAIELIKWFQPYNVAARIAPAPIREGVLEALSTLTVLRNEDTHRSLTITAGGLTTCEMSVQAGPLKMISAHFGYLRHGAQLTSHAQEGLPKVPYTDVAVQVEGTPQVAVLVQDEPYRLNQVTRNLLHFVRDEIVPALEPFVLRR